MLGLDPACGNGVFLEALHLCGFKKVVGADIDAHALSQIHLNGGAEWFLRDGLVGLSDYEGQASLVAGNPPFSAKYGRVTDQRILQRYELGRHRTTQAIEVLFCEQFIRLAKPHGAIAIILPQGVLASLPLQYVRDYLMSTSRVRAIVSLSRDIFRAKTSILFATKPPCHDENYQVFLAYAETLDDLTTIEEAYRSETSREQSVAFWRPISALRERMDVEYHLPSYDHSLAALQRMNICVEPLETLLTYAKTGGTEYGAKRRFADSGLRFISARTIRPTGIDWTMEEKFIQPGSLMDKPWAHVRPGDVLFVRVGVGCAGRVAVVMDEQDLGVANDFIYVPRLCDRVDPRYFALYAQTSLFQKQIERLKRGVGTVTIPHKALKSVKVPIPPKRIQAQYAQGYQAVVERHRAYIRAKRAGRYADASRLQCEAERLLREAVKDLERRFYN